MPEITERGLGHQDRTFDITDYEIRADATGDGFTFEGVASVVDKPYEARDEVGPFMETIRAGAFDKTLKDSKADVGLFVNHGWKWGAMPIASRMATGTMSLLTLRADPDLHVAAQLNPQRSEVRDLRTAIDDGIMRQMSIGFSVPKARQTWSADWSDRQIHELKLGEASIVWQGANQYTMASMRSLDVYSLTDVEPDELERMIAHLMALRPAPEVNPFALSADEKTDWLKSQLAA